MSDGPLHIAEEFPPASLEAWRKLLEKDLKGKPFDVLVTELEPGVSLSPLYTAEDRLPESATGFPGAAPFLRGATVLGHSREGWSVRQEYDDPRMDVAAEAIARDLARGVDSVWLRLGTDHGIRVLTAGDLERVLGAVNLETTEVCFEPETDALPITAAFVAVADARGVPRAKLRGTLGADLLGTLARVGTLSSGVETAMRTLVDLATFARAELPGMRTALVSTRPYSDAGATLVHELAWSIATGLEYVRRLTNAGFSIDEAAKQIHFAYSIGGNFFAEIAKLRAARLLWAKVMLASGASPESQTMVLHARTGAVTKSRRDPWVNVLRGTAESFAAAVGGADSVATSPFDVAIGPSDEFSRRIARNTQLMLRDESQLHRVVDPAGGSFYVEKLTDVLARAAWAELQKVEELGGMTKALTLGHVVREVDAVRALRIAAIRKRKTPVVGVSEFPSLGEEKVARASVDMNEVEGELGHPFGSASSEQRHATLMELSRLAQATTRDAGDIVVTAVAAASAGIDLFSMSSALRLGQPSVHVEPLRPFRAAMVFEALRDASDRHADAHGKTPRAFVACLGTVAEHTARVMWTVNALAAGGIESVQAQGFADASAAAAAFEASGADFLVVAGPDDRYPEWIPGLAPLVKAKGVKAIVMAGKGGELEPAYRSAGVDAFLFAGADLYTTLNSLHDTLGVSE